MSAETLLTDAGQNTQGSADGTQQATGTEPTGGQAAGGTETGAQQTQGDAATQGAQATGTEGKQDGEGGTTDGNQEGDKVGEQKPEGAPEKYEFKAPEGREYDAQVLESFSTVAKELNLSNEAAQKVIDAIAPKVEARQVERINAVREEWKQAATTDKEFGGDKLQENLGIAKKALEKFGTPELKSLFDASGIGSHPEIIRAFYRAGKAISEDSIVTGTGSAKADPRDARTLYPNSNLK